MFYLTFKTGMKAECIKIVNGLANRAFQQFGHSGNDASLVNFSEAFFLRITPAGKYQLRAKALAFGFVSKTRWNHYETR